MYAFPKATSYERQMSQAEEDLIEQLRAMSTLKSNKPSNIDSILNSIENATTEDDDLKAVTARDEVDFGFRFHGPKSPKPTRALCDKPSVASPDFDELDTTAGKVQSGIKNLRKDLDNLRKIQTDLARAFKADSQKKLLEFRKKAAKVDQIIQSKLDMNNNEIFANDHPVREQRHLLTSDQKEYSEKMTSAEKDLKELEVHMELIRINVIETKRIEHPSQLEQFHDELKNIIRSVADVKNKYYGMESTLKRVLETELELIQQEEKFLKEGPQHIEGLIKRCKLLSNTLETLQKLAKMQSESSGGSPYNTRR